ncbi:MAG: polyprenyl diphosphate synthase [Candidatus Methanodesulfokora washburnensis]
MGLRNLIWDLIYGVAETIGSPIYRRYLRNKVKRGPVPNHVGIILDGNRRFSIKSGISFREGYRIGAKKVREILDWLDELGVRHVTLYAFSTENFRRPRDQVDAIFDAMKEELELIKKDLDRLRKSKTRFRAIGRVDLLPEDLRERIKYLEDITKDFGDRTINLAVAYGGRAEIVDAVRKIARMVARGEVLPDEIDEELIRRNLYAPDLPDPDLIIRTSGEERLSNFLLWQSAYSELYFCEAYLPEFREIDLLRAIRDFQGRERRLGG